MVRLFILFVFAGHLAAGQSVGKGDLMLEVGGLPPFMLNIKGGYAIKENAVAGIFLEHHALFTNSEEIGIFGRKYMNSKRFTFYFHGGISAGRYDSWLWGDEDLLFRGRLDTDEKYKALKYVGGGGISFRLNETLSFGNEATLGISNYKGNIFPSFLFTVNCRFPSRNK